MPPTTPRRRGISLLEVIIASAIMFISLIAINQLLISGAEQAADIREQSEAVQVCQSKLNEFSCGSLGFNSQGGECEELPGWEWSIEAEQFEVQGLWQVRVRVSKMGSASTSNQVLLSQMVLDPSKRGNAADEPPPPGTTTTPDMPDEPESGPMSPMSPMGPMGQPMGQPMNTPLPMGGRPRGN